MPRCLFDDAIEFFRELEEHNHRDWWLAHRHRYDGSIRPLFVELCGRLDGFGPFRVYRPNNDVRFRSGKGPYKTFVGGVAERADGVGAFVQISAAGLLLGTGVPQPAPDQLPRLRDAIAADATGADFERAVRSCEELGVRVHGGRRPPLARTPRGVRPDHPRAEYLRWKGVETNRRVGRPSWDRMDDAVEALNAMLAAPSVLHDWLGRCVGPSALSPEERFAPRRRAHDATLGSSGP